MKILQSSKRPFHAARRRAFTLVELLLVLTILAILAGIVLPKFANRGEQAKQTAAKAQIDTLGTALSAYEIDNGGYPKTLNDLVTQPRNASNWKGPYLTKGVPLDPWQKPYVYEVPGKHNQGYDLSTKDDKGTIYDSWEAK